jgi:peroxiredoxin
MFSYFSRYLIQTPLILRHFCSPSRRLSAPHASLSPGDRVRVTVSSLDAAYVTSITMFVLVAGFVLVHAYATPASAQPAINYKVIPNLEPMKESAPTPDFTLPSLDGKRISLKDFRGKLVFLNFWATWCVPCREEMPAMEKLYQEFKDTSFIVLAVNVKDRKADAAAFVKELKLTYPIAFDPEGQVGLLYGAWGLPTTYLIGPKGEGLARAWGPAEWYGPSARKLIREIVEQKNGRR